MIHEKWFISDTHLWHANILKFVNDEGIRIRKEFQSLNEMHSTIIKNWNAVVGVNDYVYHLGDVTFRYDGAFNEIMSQLKGKKRLIVGNHDKIWNPSLMKWFEKAEVWKGFKEHNFTATHFPHLLSGLRDGAFNVHGHIHQNVMADPRYINVSAEQINYTPVHMDWIGEKIKQISS